MSDWSNLLERNTQFATHRFPGYLPMKPSFSLIVLTCVDSRVEPGHVLGLELGEALVFRNAGARVTQDITQEMSILWTLNRQREEDRVQPPMLAIIHHTDCGFERLIQPEIRTTLNNKLGMSPADLDKLAIPDHTEYIRADIERLRQSPLLPKDLIVAGYLYHVEDGHVRELIAPTPLQG